MLSKLNNEQLKVALADEPRILCLAGAGSGKTYTSIARIVNLINHGVDPHSILMLTFTNAAAFEMQERYLKYRPKDIIEIPTFRTFHSFCYSLLNRDGAILKKLGYSKVPDVADENRAASLFKTAAMQCGINMSEKKLMSNAVLSMKEQADKEIIMKAYRRLLKQKNVITFDILCYDVCQLFVDNSELVTKYKEKYKFIITDEFQDTDKRQFEFVNSFKNSNIMVVGDALQSIYSFRGADSSLIKQLADDPNWATYKLSHNYRSTKNIVKFANDFSKSYAGKSSYRVEMESDKSGPVVNVTRGQYLSRRGQVGYIDDICKTVIRHGLKNDGRVAVLCRTNAEVDTIKKYFAEHGLAVSDGKSSDYYVGVLKASIDDNYCKQLLLSKLNSEELANYIRQSYNQAEFDINTIVTMFKSNSWIIELANNVTELRKIYATCQNWSTMCVAAMSVVKCDDNVPADLSNKIHNVSELVDFIIERLESGVESNLYVGTIHSSKGLEYDTVILPGVNDTAFPLNSEDNLNLYYVGITRAKTNLYIYKW